ncbi:molybdenum ABC transporter ATP-binding protein [Fimbriiglobus ruber]|uniref:Molybdate ABC transporter ATPase n=1 Tax=Fimbriiglobus ruber TaxID=1908690 RepID=A0A225DKB5_9BACT|nr:molybdenum ABC transporter ATP-binding protein [Fimbriiglobus ruber]OWK41891.1 molybdate ABC transporter ATPase [Fimbriiglobus ruber]
MSSALVARFEKRFAGGTVVRADWERPADQFSVTALFGPSGCGKTTVLRCLAGLEKPEIGTLVFGGETWSDADRRIFLSPQRRGVGFLFQDYALFPHLTVAGNIAYGLSGLSRTERFRRVADILDVLHLNGLGDRYPGQVSGGERQRVALARALVCRPRLLLLDEPLSALDAPTRERLRPELRRVLAGFGVPAIVVTHDRTEAAALADHLVVMDRGKVCQDGPVADVFARPADAAVARIVGTDTVVPGRVVGADSGLAVVAVGPARLLAVPPDSLTNDVFVCIRAEEVVLVGGEAGASSARNRLPGTVAAVAAEGPLVRVSLDCGFPLVALVTRPSCAELGLVPGTVVTALVKAPAVHIIPRGS